MTLRLLSHVNGDGDLLEAWFRYYMKQGITSFHLIVHGSRAENAKLFELKSRFPVVIEDSYEGEFTAAEKKKRLDRVLATMTGQWLLVVDSDEFVEFPFWRIATTILMLRVAGANALSAPLLQHMTFDGSLDTPEVISDPFDTFPLCSIDLYQKMGNDGWISKFPLFYCTNGTTLSDGGFHEPPLGAPPAISVLRGVTHHFKFRSCLLQRLDSRIHSSHSWRHESMMLRSYLESHNNRLPLDGSFEYTRSELLRRRLLRRFPLRSALRWIFRSVAPTTQPRY
jgi:glycosyl transferase family 2